VHEIILSRGRWAVHCIVAGYAVLEHTGPVEASACRRCAADRDPDAGDAVAWGLDREDGGLRWLCPACTRAHVRDIEAKLPDEWWG
jgi:hypothetical protein